MSKKAVSKQYMNKLRNIGIIAHIDAGKTTLTERILYYTHKIHRMGEVHEGLATMDFMPEEQERGITIASACTSCKWGDKTINIIDTPGHVDFTIEVERSLRVLDGAIGVFCAVGGVEPQSETVWRQSEKFKIPKLAFVNKMDRLGANFEAVLESIRTKLGANPVALQAPVGQGQDFEAVIDLLTMERLEFSSDDMGASCRRLPLGPEDLELAEPWRERLIEAAAEENDVLLEMYLSGDEVPPDQLKEAIRSATRKLSMVPVFTGSALRNIGVQPIIDAVCDYLPSPLQAPPMEGVVPTSKKRVAVESSPDAPLAALVFKVTMETGRKLVLARVYAGRIDGSESVYNVTQDKDERIARLFRLHAGQKEKLDQALAGNIVALAGVKYARTGDTLASRQHPVLLESIAAYRPVISIAVEAKNMAEEDKLIEVLQKFLQEDPTLFSQKDEETGQVILSGMGELHLEVVLERLGREYGLHPRAGAPQVVHFETITVKGVGEGEFHRELGEQMHYGYVVVEVEPLPRETGTDVVFEVDTEAWPSQWLDAAEQGLRDGLQSGVLKGCPVRDARVRIKELKRVDGESSPAGYHMAAAAALRNALSQAKPALLEPIMFVEIGLPEEHLGDAVGLLGAKGAKVENILDRAGQKIIQALAPMRKLFGFSTDLRSATQGRAGMMLKFARFDVLE